MNIELEDKLNEILLRIKKINDKIDEILHTLGGVQ